MPKKGLYVLSIGGIAIAVSEHVKTLYQYALKDAVDKENFPAYVSVMRNVRERGGYHHSDGVMVSFQKVIEL